MSFIDKKYTYTKLRCLGADGDFLEWFVNRFTRDYYDDGETAENIIFCLKVDKQREHAKWFCTVVNYFEWRHSEFDSKMINWVCKLFRFSGEINVRFYEIKSCTTIEKTRIDYYLDGELVTDKNTKG